MITGYRITTQIKLAEVTRTPVYQLRVNFALVAAIMSHREAVVSMVKNNVAQSLEAPF